LRRLGVFLADRVAQPRAERHARRFGRVAQVSFFVLILLLLLHTTATHSCSVDPIRTSTKNKTMSDEGLYGALPMGFENLGPEGKQSVKKVVVKLHLKKGSNHHVSHTAVSCWGFFFL
jgi:hypothetical protein